MPWKESGSRVLWKLEGVRPTTQSGTFAELASFTVPGGIMGPNSILRVTSIWGIDVVGANAAAQVLFGTGLTPGSIVLSVGKYSMNQAMMFNVNNVAVNYASPFPSTGDGGWTQINSALDTDTIDTSSDFTVKFKGKVHTASTDTLTLYLGMIELIK